VPQHAVVDPHNLINFAAGCLFCNWIIMDWDKREWEQEQYRTDGQTLGFCIRVWCWQVLIWVHLVHLGNAVILKVIPSLFKPAALPLPSRERQFLGAQRC